MTDESGWFADVPTGDAEAAAAAITDGSAPAPADWPTRAVDAGFAADADEYYDRLHEAAVEATRAAVAERELADDRQLIHTVRAMDDCRRTANELAERVAEWAGSRYPDAGTGVAGARAIAAGETGGVAEPDGSDDTDESDEETDSSAPDPVDERVRSLARRVTDLDDEATELREFVERSAPAVAPNLAALAGPVLAARLIALAGGLGDLARQPSGTVQVLGAEDALFAHLRGEAPSPKHGVIFTHEAVRGTHPDHRGSAARALAGKLAIAARIDHYAGDRRPELAEDLADRIRRIRARTGDAGLEDGGPDGDGDGDADGRLDGGGPGDAAGDDAGGDPA